MLLIKKTKAFILKYAFVAIIDLLKFINDHKTSGRNYSILSMWASIFTARQDKEKDDDAANDGDDGGKDDDNC